MRWKEDAMKADILQMQEMGLEKLNALLKFTQPVSGKANVQIQKIDEILWVVFQGF